MSTPDAPSTKLYRGETLATAKRHVDDPTSRLAPAFDQLRTDADAALEAGPFSVTHKDILAPSGDPHDYVSQGPYWWPNPDTEDGLPYVRRDGETNPERNELDTPELRGLLDAVTTLGLGYYFLEDEAYADHAAGLLETWFLDPSTRMNPHLEYAQRIPGRTEGRGIGIVDTREFGTLLDAVRLIDPSNAWTAADRMALQDWFDAFLRWLVRSEHGREEANWHNNHRTRYDKQLQAIALFVGERTLAAHSSALVPSRHLGHHLQADGRQPHELARTRALSYSVGNLVDLFDLARLAEHTGREYWTYEPRDGTTIRDALDWLVPYLTGDDPFPYEQITDHPSDRAVQALRRAARVYQNEEYERAIEHVPGIDPDRHRTALLYPPLDTVRPKG